MPDRPPEASRDICELLKLDFALRSLSSCVVYLNFFSDCLLRRMLELRGWLLCCVCLVVMFYLLRFLLVTMTLEIVSIDRFTTDGY